MLSIACEKPRLLKLGKGRLNDILSKSNVKPHKLNYYLVKKDPDFEELDGPVAISMAPYEYLMAKSEMNRLLSKNAWFLPNLGKKRRWRNICARSRIRI